MRQVEIPYGFVNPFVELWLHKGKNKLLRTHKSMTVLILIIHYLKQILSVSLNKQHNQIYKTSTLTKRHSRVILILFNFSVS